MRDPKAWLRHKAPGAYRALVLARNAERRARLLRSSDSSLGLMQQASSVQGVVDQQAGLGGLLDNIASLLDHARRNDTELYISLESPTYRPADVPAGDYLERYFDRLGSFGAVPRERVHAARVRRDDTLEFDEGARLVWSAIRPQQRFFDAARAEMSGRYAAVHFRGSDKYLEAPRSSEDAVLAAVERQMQKHDLEQLFVASDEPQFVQRAGERFGPRAHALDLRAIAVDGTPAHFSTASGEVKAEEALVTMCVLANAATLVRTASLMSQWAVTMTDTPVDTVLVR